MSHRGWNTAGKLLTLLIAVVVIACGLVAAHLLRRGFSARNPPGTIEATLARTMRRLATPGSIRNLKNPLPATEENLAAGREHWADHCATCHGNDGSGKTEVGQKLYPRAPDMRGRDTQQLTDGELFGIIRDGIAMSGMPAWGEATGDEAENWRLVMFIRHLPKVTSEEIQQMERLNPKSPGEMEQMHQEDDFLRGDNPPGQATHHH